jgi:hypothetical protein
MRKTWWVALGVAAILIGLFLWLAPRLRPTIKNGSDELGIQILTLRPDAAIKSPLTIGGTARGTWFFEASFPVQLFDANNKLIAKSTAQADGEWMTENFVPFTTEIGWSTTPETKTGYLLFKADDPSGGENPERAGKEWKVPVRFKR